MYASGHSSMVITNAMSELQYDNQITTVSCFRRSTRDPSHSQLEKSDVKALLLKIRSNHADTVILKLKDHLMSDINNVVLSEIISALYSNKVCQALYFQNISKAMNDEELAELVELLKKKKIWCMNLGENYNVSNGGWISFCNMLPFTLVTHLYVSEHVISTDLKNKIRANIRENRKKHDKHCSLSNIHVIERCTNMWWNPINAIRHKFAADIAKEEKEREEREREERENQMREERESLAREKAKRGRFKRPLDVAALTPAHAEYWAEGVGEGGDKPWKFACTCGETCSSYEHFRYHPVGRMFECSRCSMWSHVLCVLGNIRDDDLEELQEVLCGSCRSKVRRQRLKELGAAGIVLGPNSLPILKNVDCDMDEDDCDCDDTQQQLVDSHTSGPGVDICIAATAHMSAECAIMALTNYKSEHLNTTITGDMLVDTSSSSIHSMTQQTFIPVDVIARTAEYGSASENSVIPENSTKDVADSVQHLSADFLPHPSELSDTNIFAMIETVQTVSSSNSDISLDSMVDSGRDTPQTSSRCSSYRNECHVTLERRGIGDFSSSSLSLMYPLQKMHCIRDLTEQDCVTQRYTPRSEMARIERCTIVSLNDGDDSISSNTDDDSLSVRHTDGTCVSGDKNMKVTVQTEHSILLIALPSPVQ